MADFPKVCKAPMENQVVGILPNFFLTAITFWEHKPSWQKIFTAQSHGQCPIIHNHKYDNRLKLKGVHYLSDFIYL